MLPNKQPQRYRWILSPETLQTSISIADELTIAVIVVTLQRPDFLQTCLRHIESQSHQPNEVIVVDSSPNDDSHQIVRDEFPNVVYLRNPHGPGHTGESRNIGLNAATSDIIAFLDDDAYASEDWIHELLAPYADGSVGGVGGRALNGQPNEETIGVGEIGQLRSDGTLTGYFAAKPDSTVDVDHFLGANMSFRRTAMIQVRGIRDGYPGTCLREEADLALRIKQAGWRLVFAPLASVLHVAAPYPKGKRFDIRYGYYADRNHMVLLIRIFGIRSRLPWRYLVKVANHVAKELLRSAQAPLQLPEIGLKRSSRSLVGGLLRASVSLVGALVGIVAGLQARRMDQS